MNDQHPDLARLAEALRDFRALLGLFEDSQWPRRELFKRHADAFAWAQQQTQTEKGSDNENPPSKEDREESDEMERRNGLPVGMATENASAGRETTSEAREASDQSTSQAGSGVSAGREGPRNGLHEMDERLQQREQQAAGTGGEVPNGTTIGKSTSPPPAASSEPQERELWEFPTGMARIGEDESIDSQGNWHTVKVQLHISAFKSVRRRVHLPAERLPPRGRELLITAESFPAVHWSPVGERIRAYLAAANEADTDRRATFEAMLHRAERAEAEAAELRKELAKRIDEGQRQLLMQSLMRATGKSYTQIECAPMGCAIEAANIAAELRRRCEAGVKLAEQIGFFMLAIGETPSDNALNDCRTIGRWIDEHNPPAALRREVETLRQQPDALERCRQKAIQLTGDEKIVIRLDEDGFDAWSYHRGRVKLNDGYAPLPLLADLESALDAAIARKTLRQ